MLRLRTDVVENKCHRKLISGQWREVELVQAAGSGLLCIRIDRFDDLLDYLRKQDLPHPRVFERFVIPDKEDPRAGDENYSSNPSETKRSTALPASR